MKPVVFLLSVALATAALALDPVPSNLVQPLSASSQIVIPAAGSVAGANDTFFRSDIVLVNFADRTQQIQMRWIPQAGTGDSMVTITSIAARSAIRFDDFVRQVLGQMGLGSIVITAVAGGLHDPTGLLYATSRIWTRQADGGTTSQSFDTIPMSAINSPQTAAIFGLRRSALYRANVGIVNLDPTNTQTFQVQDPLPLVDPPIIHVVTLPPLTMQQINLSGDSEVPQINITNVTPPNTRSVRWIAYGSSIDNLTGDAWSEVAITGQ